MVSAIGRLAARRGGPAKDPSRRPGGENRPRSALNPMVEPHTVNHWLTAETYAARLARRQAVRARQNSLQRAKGG